MATRAAVVGCYRNLIRTTTRVFQGDEMALRASYERIRNDFVNNSQETDPVKIKQLVEQGKAVAQYLKENVMQAVKTGDNVYRVRITEDTVLQDNAKMPLK